MIRARRQTSEPRLELTPVIDVVFLLLTFFVFALALTVRLRVSEVTLPEIGRGEGLSAESRVIVALTGAGDLLLDGEPIAWDQLASALGQRLRAEVGSEAPVLYVAPDEGAATGRLMELLDALANEGVRDVRFLRRPAEGT